MDLGLGSNLRTTSGALAISNLNAQIAGQEAGARQGRLSLESRIGWIEAIAERGHILGRIADVERANDLAETLRDEQPDEPAARIASARAKARFHLFDDALSELDEAARKGADPMALAAERAPVLQAIGDYDAALALLRAAAERRADFFSLGGLAVFHAERGETVIAERYFDETLGAYRGVSPIPLALLGFQRGHMWISRDLERARASFDETVRLLPAYVPAQGHLAEVEAALGNVEAAVSRLLPLTSCSDDPDYSSAVSGILKQAGRDTEAEGHMRVAEARYEALVVRHPEAFADHAAAFWLANGDPARALDLAEYNFAIRKTDRARRLIDRARRAAGGESSGKATKREGNA